MTYLSGGNTTTKNQKIEDGGGAMFKVVTNEKRNSNPSTGRNMLPGKVAASLKTIIKSDGTVVFTNGRYIVEAATRTYTKLPGLVRVPATATYAITVLDQTQLVALLKNHLPEDATPDQIATLVNDIVKFLTNTEFINNISESIIKNYPIHHVRLMDEEEFEVVKNVLELKEMDYNLYKDVIKTVYTLENLLPLFKSSTNVINPEPLDWEGEEETETTTTSNEMNIDINAILTALQK